MGVTSIKEEAFYRCTSMTDVYCQPTTPPILEPEIFDYAPVASIHVPQTSVEAYQSADVWSEYASKIVGYDF